MDQNTQLAGDSLNAPINRPPQNQKTLDVPRGGWKRILIGAVLIIVLAILGYWIFSLVNKGSDLDQIEKELLYRQTLPAPGGALSAEEIIELEARGELPAPGGELSPAEVEEINARQNL